MTLDILTYIHVGFLVVVDMFVYIPFRNWKTRNGAGFSLCETWFTFSYLTFCQLISRNFPI